MEKSFAALCAVPHTYPDDPTHHYEEWVVRHRVFHRTLVNACGSQWLLGFRDVLHEQSERYRRLAIRRNTEKSRNVEAEHAIIVQATLKRDAGCAKHGGYSDRCQDLASRDLHCDVSLCFFLIGLVFERSIRWCRHLRAFSV